MKFVKVNHYDNPFPKYVPIGEKKENKFLIAVKFLFSIAAIIFIFWALSYTACVAQYKSSVCKDNVVTQFIFKLIK